MKKICLIVYSIVLLSCTSSPDKVKGANKVVENSRDYKSIIDGVINRFSLDQSVSLEELQSAIPTTNEEFSIYYSYTYPDKKELIQQSFYKVDNEIGKNAINNQGAFFKLYLELSSFVDGEYAESYYEDVDFILEKNKSNFCLIYKDLSNSSKKKLEDYHTQYCK